MVILIVIINILRAQTERDVMIVLMVDGLFIV